MSPVNWRLTAAALGLLACVALAPSSAQFFNPAPVPLHVTPTVQMTPAAYAQELAPVSAPSTSSLDLFAWGCLGFAATVSVATLAVRPTKPRATVRMEEDELPARYELPNNVPAAPLDTAASGGALVATTGKPGELKAGLFLRGITAPFVKNFAENKADLAGIEISESMPWLKRQPTLGPKGVLAGDAGFDPLGFSSSISLEWMREAELKHGRICMLAFVGFITTDFYRFPAFQDLTTLSAHDACVANGVLAQAFGAITILELLSWNSVIGMSKGETDREPGYYGIKPNLQLGKLGNSGTMGKDATDEERYMELKTKEIMHCRLAMLGFGGIVTQAALNGSTFPYF